MTMGLLNSMFNIFVVFVVVVLSLNLLSYLICIHCERVSFIVVFYVLHLIEKCCYFVSCCYIV
jgi:hypothetical protein